MLQQLINFLVRPIAHPSIEALYRICVAQARQPLFYAMYEVPDTVEGRFDLLILHVFLVIERIQNHTQETQELFDILFADMDKNLREMGVSDISIAKKMKPMLAAFYGRAKAYEQALADPTILAETLKRNIYNGRDVTPQTLTWLTSYVERSYQNLLKQDENQIVSGALDFPSVNDDIAFKNLG